MGDTTFLDNIYSPVPEPQRNWHTRNNIFEIIICAGCDEKPAVFSVKHCVYKCCSVECTKKLIGKKASDVDQNERVKKMMVTMEKNLGPNPYGKIYDKLKKTNLKKYGNENPARSDKIKSMMQEKHTKAFIDNILPIDYTFVSRDDASVTLTHNNCNTEFKIPRGTFSCRKSLSEELCTKCNPQYDYLPEKEICDYLDSLGVIYRRKDRTIIKPYELDIYIPSHNLAIEHNGIYWHSELFVDNKYHQDKRLRCEAKGVHLIGIWEDEWKHKKELVKSLISNFLGANTKIGARKTIIKEIDNTVKDFINNNHLQGYVPFTKGYGLYHNNTLVEIMTFTKTGTGYELSRLCTKSGYTIQGGARRLFAEFIRNNKFTEIISYCDLTKFNGNVYKSLGDHTMSYVKPTYYYIKRDGVTIHRFHRRLFQKHLLVSKGADHTKTEKQIMNERGYYRIYNAGNLKFVYRNK